MLRAKCDFHYYAPTKRRKKTHRRLNSTFLDRAQPRRFSLHLTAQRNAANWRAKENTETDLLHHHTKFRIFFHNFIFFPFFFVKIENHTTLSLKSATTQLQRKQGEATKPNNKEDQLNCVPQEIYCKIN